MGAIFVIAQGSSDMSIGTTVALSSVLACAAYADTGSVLVYFVVVLATCLLCGLFAGTMVAVFKVPSFMTTLAMMIGVRGLVNFLIEKEGSAFAPPAIGSLSHYGVKIPLTIVLILIAVYVMEFTRMGKYSKAIGENETAAITVGLPVKAIRIAAFVLSALTAGIAGILMTSELGGTNYTMGNFFEMQVIMTIFLGGVSVTGGNSAKIQKLIIGAITLSIIENGLVLCGWTSTDVRQIVEGVLLMLVLFVSTRFNDKSLEINRKNSVAL